MPCGAAPAAANASVATNRLIPSTPTTYSPSAAGAPTSPAPGLLPLRAQSTFRPANAPGLGSTSAPLASRDVSPILDEDPADHGKFAHDPAYHWLVGTLDYSRIQQAWVLRYVPLEQEDRYGGCVTLVLSGRPMNFKRGQTVRVQGALIDPESQQLRPAFQVRDIRAEQM
jgi:hypothetical protein